MSSWAGNSRPGEISIANHRRLVLHPLHSTTHKNKLVGVTKANDFEGGLQRTVPNYPNKDSWLSVLPQDDAYQAMAAGLGKSVLGSSTRWRAGRVCAL